jgi:hypothetical protein
MTIRLLCNNVPERRSRGRKEIESAVLEGLSKRTERTIDCLVSLVEDHEHPGITVRIECGAELFSRKFSAKRSLQELEPSFIRQAIQDAVTTNRW